MRFFDGRHPRLTHVPPTVRSSVITAVLPSSRAVSAAANAVEPEPRMMRSQWSTIVLLLLTSSARLSRPSAHAPRHTARHGGRRSDTPACDTRYSPGACGPRALHKQKKCTPYTAVQGQEVSGG